MDMERYKYFFHQKALKVKGWLFQAFLWFRHWKSYGILVKEILASFVISLGVSEAVLYFLEMVNCLLGWSLDIKANDFITIVAAGISAAGVFLALYCSNIAAVFSARYSRAPEEVFNLF